VCYFSRGEDALLRAFIQQDALHKDVMLVEGPRGVGKTQLVRRALQGRPEAVCVDVEQDQRIQACESLARLTDTLRSQFGFDPGANQVLFLDEAQECPMLGGCIQSMREQWQRTTVILAGSTLARVLPPGRDGRRLALGPLRFSEYLLALGEKELAADVSRVPAGTAPIEAARHERLLELYSGFLATGGMPAAVSDRVAGVDWRGTLERVVADQEGDFVRILRRYAGGIAKAALRGVASRVGSVSTHSTVIPHAKTRHHGFVEAAFSRLESWHLVHRCIQPGPDHFHRPKRYLYDTGVLRLLRDAAVPPIGTLRTLAWPARRPLADALENQVAVEIARLGRGLQGWRTRPPGLEIDFVLRLGDSSIPIVCKPAVDANLRHLKGIAEWLEAMRQPVGVLVSFAPYSVTALEGGARVLQLPAYLFDAWLGQVSSRPRG